MLDATRWNDLICRLGRRPEGDGFFERLSAAYSESHRHYHGAAHIEHCLREFDAAIDEAEHPDEVEFAIWLHDVVYEPRAVDNEDRSAEWATEILKSLACSEPVVHRVGDLILATKNHQASPDRDVRLLTDIDLVILGQPPHIYDTYEKAIRAEYAWVSMAEYRAGRGDVLRSFLERGRIFHTDRFWTAYESSARRNLARAISGL